MALNVKSKAVRLRLLKARLFDEIGKTPLYQQRLRRSKQFPRSD